MVWVSWSLKWQDEMTLNMPCDNQVIEQHIKKYFVWLPERILLQNAFHFIFEQARNKVRSKVSIHKMYTEKITINIHCFQTRSCLLWQMLVELLDLKNHQDSEIHPQRTSGQDRNRNWTLMFFYWVSLPAETNPANQVASSAFRLKQPAGQRWNSLWKKKTTINL